MTESLEAKPFGVRINSEIKGRFAARALEETLGQQEMLEKILGAYLDDQKPDAFVPQTIEAEVTDALKEAIASFQSAAKDLEAETKRLKSPETVEGYKKGLKEIAEETSSITTLLGGINKLHEVIKSSHKMILEASTNASEPFQKIVLDQAHQAQKLHETQIKIGKNIEGLDKAASEAVAKAEALTYTLDQKVTQSVVQAAHNVFQKSERYLDDRNKFLMGLVIAAVFSTLAAAGSLYYSGFVVKSQVDESKNLSQWCGQFYDSFTSASCQFRTKNKADQINSLMKIPTCK